MLAIGVYQFLRAMASLGILKIVGQSEVARAFNPRS